jgi:hypothetical protein
LQVAVVEEMLLEFSTPQVVELEAIETTLLERCPEEAPLQSQLLLPIRVVPIQ